MCGVFFPIKTTVTSPRKLANLLKLHMLLNPFSDMSHDIGAVTQLLCALMDLQTLIFIKIAYFAPLGILSSLYGPNGLVFHQK
jgi:hypothetical protein